MDLLTRNGDQILINGEAQCNDYLAWRQTYSAKGILGYMSRRQQYINILNLICEDTHHSHNYIIPVLEVLYRHDPVVAAEGKELIVQANDRARAAFYCTQLIQHTER